MDTAGPTPCHHAWHHKELGLIPVGGSDVSPLLPRASKSSLARPLGRARSGCPSGDSSYLRVSIMQAAVAGQSEANSGLSRTAVGTCSRTTRRKPQRAKSASAVVVSRYRSQMPSDRASATARS